MVPRNLCVLLACGSFCLAQAPERSNDAVDTPYPKADQPAIPPGESPAPEGLWPSAKLMRSVLTRMADDLSERYELDDDQRTKVREATVRRWDEFLSQNRATLQPLLNEFLEIRLDPEPPSKESVQRWADRALPAFEKARDEVHSNWTDLREVFTPFQRAKFEVEALATGVGLQVAEQKLKQWREGEFELEEVWEPREGDREQRREERRERMEAAR